MQTHEVKNYFDYLYTKKLDLDLAVLFASCRDMYGFIEQTIKTLDLPANVNPLGDEAPETAKLYGAYNLFLYPLPGFHELFKEIKLAYRTFSDDEGPAYIRSWLNVYYNGGTRDWHTHFDVCDNPWHGTFCVFTEPDSHTEYTIQDVDDTVKIDSYDNMLLIGKSKGNAHRVSEWTNPDIPRITISFDILPVADCKPFYDINHWIPL